MNAAATIAARRVRNAAETTAASLARFAAAIPAATPTSAVRTTAASLSGAGRRAVPSIRIAVMRNGAVRTARIAAMASAARTGRYAATGSAAPRTRVVATGHVATARAAGLRRGSEPAAASAKAVAMDNVAPACAATTSAAQAGRPAAMANVVPVHAVVERSAARVPSCVAPAPWLRAQMFANLPRVQSGPMVP